MSDESQAHAAAEERFAGVFAHLRLVTDYARRRRAVDPEGTALANGGTIVRPHLGTSVKDAQGKVIRTISPPPARRLNLNPAYLAAIRQGLHEAAQAPGGTSDDVMGSFPMTVYGKAGTAQVVNEPDSAWFAGFVTDTNRPIVVVVHVERGGFGDVAAAPVARQILSQWFYGTPGRYRAGTNSSL